MPKNPKPDFKYGDKVAETDGYGGNKLSIVMSDPVEKEGTWYMLVRQADYTTDYLKPCTDYVKITITKEEKPSQLSKLSKKVKDMKLSRPAIITGIVLGTVMLVFLWFTGNYNSLVGAKNQTDQSWSQVETQYQRRLDLVGNLVASTKGAQGQEREVFGKIAEARTQYNNATTSSDKAAAASSVETNVALIPRLQEAYPELKSNQQVQSLMNQLTGTEDGILAARDNYNKVATNYNTNIERFPKNVFANIFGFKPFALFKAKAAAANAPEVKF